jgi:Ca2+-binding EF-hand superfamily protein
MRHLLLAMALSATPQLTAADEPKKEFDPFALEVALPPALAVMLDPNGDGRIDDEEAASAEDAFQKLPKTRKPIGQEIRKSLDANGDRKVDAAEAKQGVARGKANHKGVAFEATELVKQLDKNGDQKISPEEFRAIIEQMGVLGVFVAPRLGQFFNRIDTNRDSEISLVEVQEATDFLTEQFGVLEAEHRRQALQRDPLYQQAQRVMTTLDKNKDNLVSKIEARKNKEVNAAFLSADTTLDEHLSIEECYEYLKSKAAGKKASFSPKEN